VLEIHNFQTAQESWFLQASGKSALLHPQRIHNVSEVKQLYVTQIITRYVHRQRTVDTLVTKIPIPVTEQGYKTIIKPNDF